MMSVQLRTARDSDRTRCLALLGTLRAATGGTVPPEAGSAFDRLLDGKRGQIHVAEEDGLVLGFAAVSYNLAMRFGGEYCQLEELVVDPDARGKNIGGRLVEAVLAAAKARGCAECGLYLVPATTHNRPFYERYGFVALDVEMRISL